MDKPRKVREPAQERGREKKARILAAARTLIADQGYDGTNTNKIARKAGVSVGTVYSYFQDKRDILLGIIDSLREENFEEYSTMIEQLLAQSKDLETVWETIVRGLLAGHQRDKNLYREIWIQSFKDPEINDAFTSLENRGDHFFRLILDAYSDRIEVDDPEAAFTLIRFAMDDCIHHLVFDREQPVEAERVIRQLLKMLNRYMTRGSHSENGDVTPARASATRIVLG